VKPPPFEHRVAESAEAAVTALARSGGEAKIIAGGQSLVPMLNFRLLRPSMLIDINRIPGLASIEETGAEIRVGALTRHHQLEMSPVIAQHVPVLSAAMTYVAHLAIRNRGTIGGSLSHADPAAELPMMALLLDATLSIVSPAGRREVAAHDFFLGVLTVALATDDLVTGIAFPKLPPGTGWGFEEVSRRRGDFALAAVGVTLTVSDGEISEARIAIAGADEKAVRARDAEALLRGKALSPERIEAACEAARACVTPNTDLHASSDYRRHLVGALAGKALTAAWRRAGGVAA
jgi:CO/xanthine dehydrogenase FAD-binding subunit